MPRFIVAAVRRAKQEGPARVVPVKVWIIDAPNGMRALREARKLADADPETAPLGVRIADPRTEEY